MTETSSIVIAYLGGDHHLLLLTEAMVKLTCPKSTSRDLLLSLGIEP